MGVSVITRNLRDGTLKIVDGSGTPQELTLTLDSGDLAWVERKNTVEVLDRGELDHTRQGDKMPCLVRFSARWSQLLGKSNDAGDPLQLYEFLNALSGTGVVSTSNTGEQFTLKFAFTVTDPKSSFDEQITFAKCYHEQLRLGEGDDANLIEYQGKDFETQPTIARV